MKEKLVLKKLKI